MEFRKTHDWQIDPLQIEPPADSIEGQNRLRRQMRAGKTHEAIGKAIVFIWLAYLAWLILTHLSRPLLVIIVLLCVIVYLLLDRG